MTAYRNGDGPSEAEVATLLPEPTERPGSELPRFAGNALWLMSGEAVGKVASFLFVVIVARGLGAAQYGYFNFALSFMPLFLMLGADGIEFTLIREIARDKTRLSELFVTGLVLRVGLGLVALASSIALTRFLIRGTNAVEAVAVLGAALFLDQLSGYLGTVFKAFERMGFYALVVVTNRLLSTALAAVALAAGGGLRLVAVTYLLGSLGAFVFAALALHRYFPPIDLRAARPALMISLFRKNASFALAGWLNMAVFRLDAVLLQILKGPIAVAMYGVAYRFFESLLFVSWSLASASLPRMSDARQPRATMRTFGVSATIILSFYLPIAVGSIFTGRWLVVALFGPRYEQAAEVVTLLAASGVFYGLAILARTGLFVLGRIPAIARVAAVVLAINLGLNVLLIPRFSFTGAAVANLLTEVAEAAILVTLLLRAEGHLSLRRMAVPVLASAVMGAVLASTGFGGLRSIVVGAVSYAAVFGLTAALLVPEDARRAAGLLRARTMAVAASPLSARAPRATSPAGPRLAGMPAPGTRLADIHPPPPQPLWLAVLATLGGLGAPVGAAVTAAIFLRSAVIGNVAVLRSAVAANTAVYRLLLVTAAIAVGLGAAHLVEVAWRRVGLPGRGPGTFLPIAWTRHRIANRRVAHLIEKLRKAPAGPTRQARLVLPELARQVARRDRYTRAHPGRVQRVSAEVARHVGLPPGECEIAGLAGLLRDIGTLEIPTAILDRPGPLEPDEAEFVRHHPRLGASLLAPYLEGKVVETVRRHHERYDGGGHPDGIGSTELPAAARIVSVVDTYHALVSNRAYRPGRSKEKAFEELRRVAGTQLDPGLVEALIEVEEARTRFPARLAAALPFGRLVRAEHSLRGWAAPAVAGTTVVAVALAVGAAGWLRSTTSASGPSGLAASPDTAGSVAAPVVPGNPAPLPSAGTPQPLPSAGAPQPAMAAPTGPGQTKPVRTHSAASTKALHPGIDTYQGTSAASPPLLQPADLTGVLGVGAGSATPATPVAVASPIGIPGPIAIPSPAPSPGSNLPATPAPLPVRIGFRPFRPGSNALFVVVVFSDAGFDATTVDPASVCFGKNPPDAGTCARAQGAFRVPDVDGHGPLLMLWFRAAATGVLPGDGQACLTGTTGAGQHVRGCAAMAVTK